MHLTEESQAVLMAAFRMITDEEIVRVEGQCSLGAALDIAVYDRRIDKSYQVSIPASAQVRFWRDNDTSYAVRSKKPEYSRTRCTVFSPDSKFQVLYNEKRARGPFLFMWLSNEPMPRVELLSA